MGKTDRGTATPSAGQRIKTAQFLHLIIRMSGVVKKELLFIASEDGVVISLLPAITLATFGSGSRRAEFPYTHEKRP
jgi:hypothetical protein